MSIRCPGRILSFAVLFFSLSASPLPADTYTFFSQTQYPLTVHFIQGKKDGPTVMVQGGIQGDEPSGYITAQLLSNAVVHSGNLIVVPRANRPSIQLGRRAVNVDLNRRFDKDYDKFYEDNLARVIRFLVNRSDALVHLHEGSGFYSPVFINDLVNPNRYGQSLIIDTASYKNRLFLARIANLVLAEINSGIAKEEYKFALFNTNTFDEATQHPEQRQSLTYYALSKKGIPAVAVEVSKNIKDLPWKVRRQLQVTCLLLRQFGVDVTVPEPTDQEIANYLRTDDLDMIMQSGDQFLSCGNRASLPLASPLALSVESIRGLDPLFNPALAVFASDRPGVDLLRTPRLPLQPFNELCVYADGRRLASVPLDWWSMEYPPPRQEHEGTEFILSINGHLTTVAAGSSIEAVEGDQLVLEGVLDGSGEEILNVKGYVSNLQKNDGQDAGVEIILNRGAMLDQYVSSHKDGSWSISVVRETQGVKPEQFQLKISPRKVMALNLKHRAGNNVSSLHLPWESGRRAALPAGEYFFESVEGNGPSDKVIVTAGEHPLPASGIIDLKPGRSVFITLRQATTFAPIGNMLFVSPYLQDPAL